MVYFSVRAQVTVGLLKDAMERSGKTKILIDGFPRNDSNREVFQKVVGYDCSLVLFFDCPEDVLEKRLLSRNQGRVDDNIETIKKASGSLWMLRIMSCFLNTVNALMERASHYAFLSDRDSRCSWSKAFP